MKQIQTELPTGTRERNMVKIPWLTRDQVKDIVGTALHEVADYKGDFEHFDFSKFQQFHKLVFINAIAQCMQTKGFSVTLSIGKLGTFPQLKDLVDYIDDKQAWKGPVEPRITLP